MFSPASSAGNNIQHSNAHFARGGWTAGTDHGSRRDTSGGHDGSFAMTH